MDACATLDASETALPRFTYVIKIGLYCDCEVWILGTIAKRISRVHGNRELFRFEIRSWQQFMEHPLEQIHRFRRRDIIH